MAISRLNEDEFVQLAILLSLKSTTVSLVLMMINQIHVNNCITYLQTYNYTILKLKCFINSSGSFGKFLLSIK